MFFVVLVTVTAAVTVNTIIAPMFFVVFVLMAQFVLVNVVVAVLMKHLEVRQFVLLPVSLADSAQPLD